MNKRQQRMSDEDKLYFEIEKVLDETDRDKTIFDEEICIHKLRMMLREVKDFLDEKLIVE